MYWIWLDHLEILESEDSCIKIGTGKVTSKVKNGQGTTEALVDDMGYYHEFKKCYSTHGIKCCFSSKGHEWLCCIQSQIQGKQDELRKVRRNVMYKFGCHVLSNAKEAMYIDQTKLYQQERLKA